MRFETALDLDQVGLLRMLGYQNTPPDGAVLEQIALAEQAVSTAATPRWVWRSIPIGAQGDIRGTGIFSVGSDIAAHLEGCEEAVLLAVTLGSPVEEAIRAAGAVDVGRSVLLDHAASVLVEQYTDEAERFLRRTMEARGLYLTGRYSPGYGDFPLGTQEVLLRLLDAPRAIGLHCGAGGLLLPRKSVTAVLGAARWPMQGLRRGCENCSMREQCRTRASF